MESSTQPDVDVVVIGAGPSGAIAASLLCRRGYRPLVLERSQFPRFAIGESLLPQCMEQLAEAGLEEAVHASAEACGFQHKNGAVFERAGRQAVFDFADKTTAGPAATYQVRRSAFDQLLADEAERAGADVRYRHEIVDVALESQPRRVMARRLTDGAEQSWTCRFVLDGSGLGRVLPRLLDLERPSTFPVRQALFTHVSDHITDADFDRAKILVCVHPGRHDVWYWLIPFADGRSSIGVVGPSDAIEAAPGDNETAKLWALIDQAPTLRRYLARAALDTETARMTGYSANVTRLWGPGYALLGNAGEFLDPIFSSGVTVAMKSASLAVATLDCELTGEAVDWQRAYADPLQAGVDTFRHFVEAWYDGALQDILFGAQGDESIRQNLTAVLAGYAWDRDNPYVRDTRRRLSVLASVCRKI